ncbi:phage regulatory CII family protein [Castellaniella sp. UC4442_H9]
MSVLGAYAYEVAAFQTISQWNGGAHALGPIVGINGSVLAHKVSLTDDANQLTVPQARTVMQATGDYRMLVGLAQDLGHVCTQQDNDKSAVSLELAIAQATKEFGEYLSAVSAAVTDRVVTTNELRRIDRELGEHQAAVNRLRAVCAALLSPKGR